MSLWERLARWWCKHRHQHIFRPVRGFYRCAECLREWPAEALIPALYERPHLTAPRRIEFTCDERSALPRMLEMGMEIVDIRVGKDIIVQVRK